MIRLYFGAPLPGAATPRQVTLEARHQARIARAAGVPFRWTYARVVRSVVLSRLDGKGWIMQLRGPKARFAAFTNERAHRDWEWRRYGMVGGTP